MMSPAQHLAQLNKALEIGAMRVSHARSVATD
jgi:hypothetical protein